MSAKVFIRWRGHLVRALYKQARAHDSKEDVFLNTKTQRPQRVLYRHIECVSRCGVINILGTGRMPAPAMSTQRFAADFAGTGFYVLFPVTASRANARDPFRVGQVVWPAGEKVSPIRLRVIFAMYIQQEPMLGIRRLWRGGFS
jgi:hypothetical protein